MIKVEQQLNKETLGHKVEARGIEFVEDVFDGIDEVWQTKKSEQSEDKKGVDAGIRYAGYLIAPDFTTL